MIDSKIDELVGFLKERNITISSIESLTGGLFASSFTSVSGASKVYDGSFVTYTNEVKNKCGVKKEILDQYGAISFQCAKEMALACKRFFKTDIAVSFTGNAGPTNSENKEVGLVFISILIYNHLYSYKIHFSGNRNEIRESCVTFASCKILEILKNS